MRPTDCISTWFGLGLAPKAPGTFGTLGAIPLVLFAQGQEAWLQWLTWALLLVISIFCVRSTSVRTKSVDPQIVVVDEVLGLWLSALIFGFLNPLGILTAFVLFRAFDIFKPFPIRNLDRFGKKLPLGNLQSFLVIADDLLAGIFSGASLLLLRFFFPNLL
jgi:phosphatidylglycerophosphatase A